MYSYICKKSVYAGYSPGFLKATSDPFQIDKILTLNVIKIFKRSCRGFLVNYCIREGGKVFNVMLMSCVLILGRAQEQIYFFHYRRVSTDDADSFNQRIVNTCSFSLNRVIGFYDAR